MTRFFLFIFSVFLFISCSPHWTVRKTNTENITIETHPGSIDSTILSVLKPYRDSIEHDMSKFVTRSKIPLVKGKPESKLTNLVSDLILEFGDEYCKINHLNVKPDASYVNYGGLRSSLPEGKITVGHIFELMPFENEIVLLKLTGDSFLKMADQIAGRGGEGVSGMTIGIRDNKAGIITIGGKPLDKSANYWLVTNDYVAKGGDQMSMFVNPLDAIYIHVKIRDLVMELLEKHYQKDGSIDVKEDGRIYYEQ